MQQFKVFFIIMASQHGSAFRITDPLCVGNPLVTDGFPLTKLRQCGVSMSFSCSEPVPERTADHCRVMHVFAPVCSRSSNEKQILR